MQATSIGDLAQTLMLQQRSAAVRQDMLRLNQEMSTGRVYDVARRLGGDFAQLSSLEHRLTVVEGFRVANSEAAAFTETAQARLGNLTNVVSDLGTSLLSLGTSPLTNAINAASEEAKIALEDAVQNLNGTYAGRALFSGIATDQQPLVSADELLDELRIVLNGAATATDVLTGLSNWFDDPAGFQAFAYRGSDVSLAPISIDENRRITFDIRADQTELRNALRDLAGAALAGDTTLALSATETANLFTTSGQNLLASRDGLIFVSAELGVVQEAVEQSAVRGQSEKISLEMARNALIEADPFEIATQLERVQFQLESLYAVTARTSQLSLVRFL